MSVKNESSNFSGFIKKNDDVRLNLCTKLEPNEQVALQKFFRRVDAPYFWEDRVKPLLELGEATMCIAYHDRPWPPWGFGAQRVHAFSIAYPVGEKCMAISPVFSDPEDATNIGLIAATFKELINELCNENSVEIAYAVLEGGTTVSRLMSQFEFEKSDDLILTEQGRYNIYRANGVGITKALGIAEVSVQEILAYDINDKILEKSWFFHGIINTAVIPGIREIVIRPEMIIVDLGRFDASLPGGVPPAPPPPS